MKGVLCLDEARKAPRSLHSGVRYHPRSSTKRELQPITLNNNFSQTGIGRYPAVKPHKWKLTYLVGTAPYAPFKVSGATNMEELIPDQCLLSPGEVFIL